MSTSSFAKSLKLGLANESIITKYLNSRNFIVIPAYQIEQSTGKGPRVFAPMDEQLITPDLLCIRNGKMRWTECKSKAEFVLYRKTGIFQTGFDIACFEQYQRVQEVTGIPVYIMFLNAPRYGISEPSGLYYQTLDKLVETIDHSCTNEKTGSKSGGLHYWNEYDLIKQAEYNDVMIY